MFERFSSHVDDAAVVALIVFDVVCGAPTPTTMVVIAASVVATRRNELWV